MDWWKEFKEKYPIGTIIELTVGKKVPPSLLFFSITKQVQGSLHISELNWNFGLCQTDFRSINVKSTINAYIIGYDDKFKKVHFGRKLLQSIVRPSLTDEWKTLVLQEKCLALVFEEFKNKVIVKLESGLFASLPLIEGKSFQIGSKIAVIPIRKNAEQDIVECVLEEILESSNEQSSNVVRTFKETASENEYSSSDTCLNSLEQLTNSIYWNYFDEQERIILKQLFEETNNLYSKVDKGEEPISFEFDFNTNAFNEFTNIISPLIFDANRLPTGFTNKDLLVELSKQKFWYTQSEKKKRIEGVEQDIIEKQFSLFNDTLSIRGLVTDDGMLKIRNIKAKNKSESLREKQNALKYNKVFFINRPIVFSQFAYQNTYNQTFIRNIDNKITAYLFFDVAKTKSIDILQQQGKDFKIFHKYLESQIDFEVKAANNTEIQLTECNLELDIRTDGVSFVGKLNGKCDLKCEDKVIISNKTDEGKPQILGSGIIISNKDGNVKITSSIEDFDLVKKGCSVKRFTSTKQFAVQVDVLNKFFSNTLPLDVFYKIFHDRNGILPPKEVNIKYFNELFKDKENPQTEAIKKAVGNRNILLIQGPPGTGKTTVITEIVKQLVFRGEKLLVTSQTHIAVDNVLERIKDDPNIKIARVGHQETISDFAVEHLLDEARKRYAKTVQTIVDIKISLLKEHLYGTEKSNHIALEAYKETSTYQLLKSFISSIKNSDSDKCLRTIKVLESWRTVVAKTPKLLTDIFLKDLNVIFGTCIGIATSRDISESDIVFDTVILDEAGKANISETLTAISKAKKIILVGDHKQLPPYLDQEKIEYFKSYYKEDSEQKLTLNEIKHALGISFFEYLQKDGILKNENKILLAEQHRMHPDIGNFISLSFYNSELKNGEKTVENVIRLPEPFNKQIIFIDTSTDRSSYESFKDGSYYNQVEADFIIKKIIPEFERNNINPKTYAIVTPYSKQSEKIRELLLDRDSHSYNAVEVATLDSFQGRELDIIIFSFTRSSIDKKVGFLDDARRLNVAFSRAKKKLILIGNASTLKSPKAHVDVFYTNLFNNLWKYSSKYGKTYRINELDYKKLQSNIKLGDILKAKVTRFDDYGVLVNLGLTHGLILNKDLSWEKSINPKEIIELDQEIYVKVIRVNEKGILLSLREAVNKQNSDSKVSITKSLKKKKENDFVLFSNEFKVNDSVEGIIQKITEVNSNSLKVTVELKYGIQGTFFTYSTNNRLKTGKPIKVTITKIDIDKCTIKCKPRI